MSRFCMFCGKEMPENAMFCPSCGAKQPEQFAKEPVVEEIEYNTAETVDNAALSILNKANFSTKKKQHSSDVIRVEQPVAKEEPKRVFADEENTSVPESGNSQTEEIDDDIPDFELDDSEPEEYMTEEAIKTMAELEIMAEKGNVSSGPDIIEGITDEADEKRLSEKIDEIKEKGAGWTGNSSEKREKPTYKKRNISEEDESEEEPASHEMSSTSHIGSIDEMTADEKADLEKHKRYKEEEEKEKKKATGSGEGRVKGEGRKSNGRKKEVRENIDKKIAERKVSDVEHEETKDNSDPDYDGYYENVKPIDFDKQKDNTAVVKTALTGIAFIALASAVFYVLITFFIQ